jgi:hypothetical protein
MSDETYPVTPDYIETPVHPEVQETLAEKYERLTERFQDLTDEELIQTRENDRGNPGWVSTRGAYVVALRDEYQRRNLSNY